MPQITGGHHERSASNVPLHESSHGGGTVPKKTVSAALDSGWAWVVLVGASLNMLLASSLGPCFGILFGPRLTLMGAGPALGFWIFNIQSMIWNLCGPLACPLSEQFSNRKVAIVGALLLSSSLFFSAVAASPLLLLFTFSVFSGVGGGLCINCGILMIGSYFRKHLGLANGILSAGGSLGLMLLPQLASLLQEEYPFNWATFIVGAVMLNTVIGSALFQPLSWHIEKVVPEEEGIKGISDEVSLLAENDMGDGDPSKPQTAMAINGSLQNVIRKNTLVAGVRTRTQSECTPSDFKAGKIKKNSLMMGGNDEWPNNRLLEVNKSVEQKIEKNWLSMMELGATSMGGSVCSLSPSKVPKPQVSIGRCDLNQDESLGPWQGFTSLKEEEDSPGPWQRFASNYHIDIIKKPLPTGIAAITALSIFSSVNLISQIPFVVSEAGFTLQQAALAMSVVAVVDLFSRLMVAAVVDLPWLNPKVLYVVGQIILIAMPLGFVVAQHWWAIVLCSGLTGIGLAIVLALDVFIMVTVAGIESFQAVFGLSQLFRAISFLVLGPLGGVLREATESYSATLFFFSCIQLLALIMMVATTFAAPCFNKTRTT